MLRQIPEEDQPTGTQSSSHLVEEHRVGHIPPPTQLKTRSEFQAQPSASRSVSSKNPIIGLTVRQWSGSGGAKGFERYTRPIILALVLFFTGFFTFIEPGITGSVLTAINILLVLLSGAASIAGERENKTWDALRLSRIGTTRIILGKWFSAAFPAIITQTLFALLLLITPVTKTISTEKWLLIQAIMGASTLFATALSVYVSSTAASTQKAQGSTVLAAFISTVIGGFVNGLVGSTNPIFAVGLLILPDRLRTIVDAPVSSFPNWIMTAITIMGSAVLFLVTFGQLAKPEEEVVPIAVPDAKKRLETLRATHGATLPAQHVETKKTAASTAMSAPIQQVILNALLGMPIVSEHPLIGKELRSILMPAGTQSGEGSLRWTLIGGAIGMMFVFTILTAADGADFRQNAAYRVYLGIATAIYITVQTAATSIPKEREKQTWNAMLLSRISLREIIMSKAVAACVPGLLIVAAIIPMLVIGLIASGGAWHAVLTAPTLMVTILGVAGSIGMLLGAVNRNSRSASLQAALLTMILLGSPFIGSSVLALRGFTEAIIGMSSMTSALAYIGGSVGFTALVG
ncbi:MAG: ABC transporter permease subunit, partial [Armatimonadaceae bacterium]